MGSFTESCPEEALQQLVSRGHPVHDHSCTEKTACGRGPADAHIKVRRGGSCLFHVPIGSSFVLREI